MATKTGVVFTRQFYIPFNFYLSPTSISSFPSPSHPFHHRKGKKQMTLTLLSNNARRNKSLLRKKETKLQLVVLQPQTSPADRKTIPMSIWISHSESSTISFRYLLLPFFKLNVLISFKSSFLLLSKCICIFCLALYFNYVF